MTHPLAGHLEVDESAKTVRHYRYAVERMTRILGGWMARPELSAKLLMGRHVWDNAQHADAWGRRLPELRAAAQVSEPANARLVAFLDAVEAAERPEQTIERLVAIYRVLKPHLLAAYKDHLATANAVPAAHLRILPAASGTATPRRGRRDNPTASPPRAGAGPRPRLRGAAQPLLGRQAA
jgi:hypothetical protein